MKRDTQRSPALICASFAARAAAKMVKAASGSLHRWLNRVCIRCSGAWTTSTGPYTAQRSDPIRGRERYLAESIAELREIVNGHDDILAEAASRLARGTPARLPVSGMG